MIDAPFAIEASNLPVDLTRDRPARIRVSLGRRAAVALSMVPRARDEITQSRRPDCRSRIRGRRIGLAKILNVFDTRLDCGQVRLGQRYLPTEFSDLPGADIRASLIGSAVGRAIGLQSFRGTRQLALHLG